MNRPNRGSLSSLNNEQLIGRLRSADGGDDAIELQNEIVQRNIGLVKSIAARFLASGEPLDDLIQAGYIGLLNAAANFDLARNTRFSTYASYLIQGEIRHFVRDKHTTIRIPQWVQTMNRRVKEAEEAFFQQHGRAPLLSELAAAVDLTEQQITALLRGRESMTYVSIDQDRRGSDPNPAPPTTEHLLVKSDALPFDARMKILLAIEELSEIQREVIRGLFYQGKSQSEVGEELGISQRQVSRVKQRVLDDLRESLLETPEPES